MSTLASDTVSKNPDQTEVSSLTEVYINPLYENIIGVSDLKTPSEANISTANVSEYYTSTKDVAKVVRKEMQNRTDTFEVGLQAKEYESQMPYDIVDEALLHTGNPTEGDYLLWQFGGWNCKISYYDQNDVCYITFQYTITYYTTKSQEDELNIEVKNTLEQLNLDEKSDFEKIKSIYDYICENIVYDFDNSEDTSYMLKHTAYAALVNKTAVCQGYATLFYRLSLEASIDARLIPGTSNGSDHGWNIVQLDEQYYNLDSTWDAGKSEYDYFLRCNDHFPKHTRSEEYETEEFNNNYPMSTEDYDVTDDNPPIDNPETQNPFIDVDENEYYYNAVLWAFENGVTTGSDETHFNPFDSCTRAQAITFLWRANGMPEPSITSNPFIDITSSDYYYKAVLWAFENSVTSGLDSSHFAPSNTVTRKEFITFLWRANGTPEPSITENPFVDVPNDEYYTKAVLWAFENGITTGSDKNHFQVDEECVRAHVVTFLYRVYHKE